MDERRIGALEAAAETDRAQFFGAGIAPKRPRDAGVETDAMGVTGGLTGVDPYHATTNCDTPRAL